MITLTQLLLISSNLTYWLSGVTYAELPNFMLPELHFNTCKQTEQAKHYFTSIRVLAGTEKDRTLVETE